MRWSRRILENGSPSPKAGGDAKLARRLNGLCQSSSMQCQQPSHCCGRGAKGRGARRDPASTASSQSWGSAYPSPRLRLAPDAVWQWGSRTDRSPASCQVLRLCAGSLCPISADGLSLCACHGNLKCAAPMILKSCNRQGRKGASTRCHVAQADRLPV